MKITCDNCGAKYSIADEKVRGKVFKIRCKKCSHIVVVRGASTASSETAQSAGEDEPGDEHVAETAGGLQAAQPAAAQDSPVWHLVVGREQVGPVTSDEIRARLSRGEISGESYVWRDGFADWMRLNAVRDFAEALQPAKTIATSMSPEAPLAAEPELEPTPTIATQQPEEFDQPAAGTFGQQPSGVGLFGERTEAQAVSPAMSEGIDGTTPEPASDGLFGGVAAASGHQRMFPEEDDEEGADLGHPHMTGQRGENSVLFSLANLQALAMSDSAAAPAATAAAKPSTSTSSSSSSSSSDEGGSGLIDIRAMAASATGTGRPVVGAEPDLPTIGGMGGGMAVAPMLMPGGGTERPKWLIPAVVALGAVLLISVILLTVLLVRSPSTESPKEEAAGEPTQVAAMGAEAAGTAPASATATPADEGKTEAATGSGAETDKGSTAAAAAPKSAEKTQEPSGKSASKPRTRRKRSSTRPKSSTRSAAAKPAPAQRRTAKKRQPRDELDRLLDDPLSARKRSNRPARGAAAPVDKNLPQQLSRSQIVGGMRSVKAGVQRCYDRFKVPGLANVKLKIGNAGRVKDAEVKGRFAGTPTGACVKRAVKKARFPKFQISSMSITYPFMLR